MKRIFAIILGTLVMISAAGCGNHGTPVARVVTSSVDDGGKSYETVYEDGEVKKTDKFTPEDATIYQADEGILYMYNSEERQFYELHRYFVSKLTALCK